jgi:hypothetical protein
MLRIFESAGTAMPVVWSAVLGEDLQVQALRHTEEGTIDAASGDVVLALEHGGRDRRATGLDRRELDVDALLPEETLLVAEHHRGVGGHAERGHLHARGPAVLRRAGGIVISTSGRAQRNRQAQARDNQ